MNKVTLHFITETDKWHDRRDSLEVVVNGETIATGEYGGEPEDNCRSRDYRWVEQALMKLANKLGADLVIENTERTVDYV